jgi:hypothetical protein
VVRLYGACKNHKPWIEEQKHFLEKNYQSLTAREIGKMLGRSHKAVARQAGRMHLRASRRYGRGGRPWTEEEEKVLIENYGKTPYQEIAQKIDRTKWAVRARATKLGLTKYQHSLPTFNLTDIEKGYIAGIIDGEGTITVTIEAYGRPYCKNKRPYLRPLLEVANNSKEIIEKLKTLLGGSYSEKTYQYKGIKKPNYEWIVSGVPRSLAILREIAPHLIQKKKVAYALMEFCESRIRNFRQPHSETEVNLANEIRNMSGAKRPRKKNVLELLRYHQEKSH